MTPDRPSEMETYASAGVDIQRADRFVERLKARSRRAGHDRLWKGAGGYAAVYPMTETEAVAMTTDGVGTKLMVAHQLSRHDTIGIDLVAMCANDLICVGARPTLFLDYLATGALDDDVADAIVSGLVAGCDEAGMILAGGETAEMPGIYGKGHYDLAGFAVGQVNRQTLITGDLIRPGQILVGVASSGIHSNGLSLARKVLAEDEDAWNELLVPTRIYVEPVLESLRLLGGRISGIAHITGGGWTNLFRLNSNVGYHLDNPLPLPGILRKIAARVAEAEMYRTFNMGMGLALICDERAGQVVDLFNERGHAAQVVGSVTDEPATLTISGSAVRLQG